MKNYKAVLMYDGSGYDGWQRLGGDETKKSIQGVLEYHLRELLQEDVSIIGSGRTDKGVHAIGQMINFRTSKKVNFDSFKSEWNQLLPPDIKIKEIQAASPGFHSRYHAVKKWYEYYIDNSESAGVFTRKYTYHIPERLDIDRMQQAIALLKGKHDFKGFSSNMYDERQTVKTIYEAEVFECDAFPVQNLDLTGLESGKRRYICIRLCGDGFLYHMVRIIAGTIAAIGHRSISEESIAEVLSNGNRELASYIMEPQGLFLKKVEY